MALLITMLAIAILSPGLFRYQQVPTTFDQSRVDQLEAASPAAVFLGNSILDTRIDPQHLTELTGFRATALAVDGSAPGIWFLQMKNVIGASTNRPDTVFIFFHDDLISRPISFTGPADEKLVEQLSHKNEDSYLEVINAGRSFRDNIGQVLSNLYPLIKSSTTARESVSSIGAYIGGLTKDDAVNESERVFAFANKRDQNPAIQQPKFHGSFESAINHSFLPLLIAEAEEHSLNLIVVRVSARPRNDGTPNEPDELALYSANLSNYLESNGVRFVDMTGHTGIDAGMYYDGYHIKHRFRTYYTEMFSEWLLSEWGSNS